MENYLLKKDFDIEKLQEEYLNYIDVSKRTHETYDMGIRQFAMFMADKGIKNPTRNDVILYREELKKNHSVSTVNTYLIALRNFFKFLSYEGIYTNITENIKGLTDTNLHKREALSIEECKQVLELAENLREKTIFVLTLSCGLRANEIINIELNDFKEKEGKNVLYVLGKGRSSKQDYVVVPDDVLEIIKQYVKEYGIKDYLFVSTSQNNKGNKMATCSIRRIVNKMFERAGVKRDTITLHSLRHSFGTIAIENGENIRDVSKAMRHKSIVVTETYLHDLATLNNKCGDVVSSKILGGIL